MALSAKYKQQESPYSCRRKDRNEIVRVLVLVLVVADTGSFGLDMST